MSLYDPFLPGDRLKVLGEEIYSRGLVLVIMSRSWALKVVTCSAKLVHD